MYVAILGRQPEISIAELQVVFGEAAIKNVAPDVAIVDSRDFDLNILGSVTKYGQIVKKIDNCHKFDKQNLIAASNIISDLYLKKFSQIEQKITLGISAYNLEVAPFDVQKTALLLKSKLKKLGKTNLRIIPNKESILSTAVSHNNKLGLSSNKIELMIIKTGKQILIAESCGSQNITAYANRDQNRPKRDAFVGMLPPKLAQIMINLALGDLPKTKQKIQILDPFCGTGVILQESILRNFTVYGSDLNQKMIDYTAQNLQWLKEVNRRATGEIANLSVGDAITNQWINAKNLDAIICETYLGQPFSAPPSNQKLREVIKNCDYIITSFLKNIHPQLKTGTKLCIAIPAWQDNSGNFSFLPLLSKLQKMGYIYHNQSQPLLYHRPDQVVARQLLILETN